MSTAWWHDHFTGELCTCGYNQHCISCTCRFHVSDGGQLTIESIFREDLLSCCNTLLSEVISKNVAFSEIKVKVMKYWKYWRTLHSLYQFAVHFDRYMCRSCSWKAYTYVTFAIYQACFHQISRGPSSALSHNLDNDYICMSMNQFVKLVVSFDFKKKM